MAEPPEDLHARVTAAAGPDGLLPLPDISGWTNFPWVVVDGAIAAAPLRPPVEPEPPRWGETPEKPCGECSGSSLRVRIWENERFFVSMDPEPSGLPLVLWLQTHEHLDYPDLDDDEAAECGRLSVQLCRILERLEHVGRAHVLRVGDGSEHCHVWFTARPAGFEQIVGSAAIDWDDILPPVPRDVRDADAAWVAQHLATHSGRALV